MLLIFFFKQMTAYEMRISDWSSDVCSSDLDAVIVTANKRVENVREVAAAISVIGEQQLENMGANSLTDYADLVPGMQVQDSGSPGMTSISIRGVAALSSGATVASYIRSEEHTSERQSLMRSSYAVFCLKKT